MKEIYSCVIVDDEPAAHIVLKNYINKEPRLKLVAECYNALEFMEYLKDNDVDLLFLDIHMPEINGFEFLQSYVNPPKTVLTTAYSQYALESYDYDVIDYLMKPISYSRFERATERFFSLYNLVESFKPQIITIKVDKNVIQLSEVDIDYIQSLGNYVKVFVGSKYYLASTTTQEILSNLSPNLFVRIHKSYAVNLTKVADYSEKELIISNKVLPVGITFKRQLLQRIKKMK